jgi:hypothetical protein
MVHSELMEEKGCLTRRRQDQGITTALRATEMPHLSSMCKNKIIFEQVIPALTSFHCILGVSDFI